MKSIIVFCKALPIGGAEKQALTLAKLLTEKNVNTILVNWCGDKIDSTNLSFINEHAIQYIGLDGNPLKKFIRFNTILRSKGVSVVLSYLTLANFVAGICKLINKKLISIGGIRTEKFPFYKLFFEKLVHNYLNDATVFNNYSAKGKFELRGFNPKKIHVIHNAINVKASEKKDITKKDLVVTSISRFVASKDFPTALNSFKKVTERNKSINLKYRLVGYGPLESRIRMMIEELDLVDKVDIVINPPNMPEILKGCDIYLSTSLYEGLSNSIMEAMAAGLPVIATNVGDNIYLIKDSYNGFVVPKKDIDSVAEKLELLIKNEILRNEFGYNSWLKISTEFSEEKLIENYFKLFFEMGVSVSNKDKRQ